MEECRKKVIKLHAIYSMIISKSTSNISKNTSKIRSAPERTPRRILSSLQQGGAGKEEADQARREAEDRTHILQ